MNQENPIIYSKSDPAYKVIYENYIKYNVSAIEAGGEELSADSEEDYRLFIQQPTEAVSNVLNPDAPSLDNPSTSNSLTTNGSSTSGFPVLLFSLLFVSFAVFLIAMLIILRKKYLAKKRHGAENIKIVPDLESAFIETDDKVNVEAFYPKKAVVGDKKGYEVVSEL